MSTKDLEMERLVAMLCHASSLLWLPLLIVGVPIPFANVVIPLVVWLLEREQSPFIDRHGRESLNFQLSMLLYSLGLIILGIFLAILWFVVLGFGGSLDSGIASLSALVMLFGYGSFVLFWSLIQLVLVIWASIRAQRGRHFRYPLTIRFLGAPRSSILEQPLPDELGELKKDPFELPPNDVL
ncbi:MAG: DUF4870 domain-containing protein [Spirulina sp. SIO3F2]|nr:DUF4870 domain-containing protein [Spirulina sp. SIO3F2]